MNVDHRTSLLIECLKCTLCGFKDESFITTWFCLQVVFRFLVHTLALFLVNFDSIVKITFAILGRFQVI